MIVQSRHFLIRALVVAKVEAHIKEHLACLLVFLHLGSREAVDEPVDSVVFPYAAVDEFRILWCNSLSAEDLARLILPHVDLIRVSSPERRDGLVDVHHMAS